MLELARRWPAESGPVTILTTRDGRRQIAALRINDAHVESLTGPAVDSHAVVVAYAARALVMPYSVRHLVKQRPPAIVISASTYPPDVIGGLVARSMGVPWALSWQLIIPSPSVGYAGVSASRHKASVIFRRPDQTMRVALSFWSQTISLWAARRWSRTLLVATHEMAKDALKRGFLPNRVLVTGYGVDPEEVADASRRTIETSETYDAIFVGRFHAQKGLDDLVLVWRRVLEVLPQARLAVIGDGDTSEARKFKSELADFDPASVCILGPLSGDQKFRHLSQARVFIFPSHHESWGLVALEAMAVGLPVVGYDLPSSKEVYGEAMVMVPLGNTDAMASAVIALLKSDRNRTEYASRSRELAQRYDWSRISQRLVATLH